MVFQYSIDNSNFSSLYRVEKEEEEEEEKEKNYRTAKVKRYSRFCLGLRGNS